MTTNPFFSLIAGLQSKLDEISGHPTIVFDNNEKHKPVIGTRYWRTTLLPATAASDDLESGIQHRGFYQIDVIVPSETGVAQMMQDLDDIFEKFKNNRIINSNTYKIKIESIRLGDVLREGAWTRGFVELEYRMHS